jgi:site-specific recombinase XerD
MIPGEAKPTATVPGAPVAALLPSWELSLTERELSPKTIEVYMRTGTQFAAWLAKEGLPADTEGIDAPHIRAFLAAETARTSAISSHQHFRNLRVLFRWLAKEDERTGPNPMERVDPPKTTRKVKPVLAEAQLAALIKGCEGTTFEQRRDMAVIRVFIDSGVRVSGVANVRLKDVSLTSKTVKVVLKGGDEHLVPIGRKAAAALDRYIRARARHRHADSPWLWLGTAGRDPAHFGSAGIQDMLERRGRAAGIGKVTPHWFRRTFAHDWLDSGGSELDGMRIAGWKTRAMIEMYAGELAGERARQAHARLSPGDRI